MSQPHIISPVADPATNLQVLIQLLDDLARLLADSVLRLKPMRTGKAATHVPPAN